MLVDIALQVGELAVLEDQIEISCGLLEIEQRHDVVVLDDRQNCHFPLNALQCLLGDVLQGDLLDCEPSSRGEPRLEHC